MFIYCIFFKGFRRSEGKRVWHFREVDDTIEDTLRVGDLKVINLGRALESPGELLNLP